MLVGLPPLYSDAVLKGLREASGSREENVKHRMEMKDASFNFTETFRKIRALRQALQGSEYV